MSESQERLLRLKEVLKLVPTSKAAWYAGIKSGRYPGAVRLGPRMVAWRYSDIQKLMQEGAVR